MYEIMIRLNDIICNLTIEELTEVKEILEQFKSIDEFNLKYAGRGSKENDQGRDPKAGRRTL